MGTGRVPDRQIADTGWWGMMLLDRFKPQIAVNANCSSGVELTRRIWVTRSGRHFSMLPAKATTVRIGARQLPHHQFVPVDRHSFLKLFSFDGDYVYSCLGKLSVDLDVGVERIRNVFADYPGID